MNRERRGRLGLSLQLIGLTALGVMLGADRVHWLALLLSLFAIGGGMYLWIEQGGQP